ncbi:MAG: hypothetical protein GY937_20725 [bacterium]|nr:hypothetical protein [bacterium]
MTDQEKALEERRDKLRERKKKLEEEIKRQKRALDRATASRWWHKLFLVSPDPKEALRISGELDLPEAHLRAVEAEIQAWELDRLRRAGAGS